MISLDRNFRQFLEAGLDLEPLQADAGTGEAGADLGWDRAPEPGRTMLQTSPQVVQMLMLSGTGWRPACRLAARG
jgi:hypothetical protein